MYTQSMHLHVWQPVRGWALPQLYSQPIDTTLALVGQPSTAPNNADSHSHSLKLFLYNRRKQALRLGQA